MTARRNLWAERRVPRRKMPSKTPPARCSNTSPLSRQNRTADRSATSTRGELGTENGKAFAGGDVEFAAITAGDCCDRGIRHHIYCAGVPDSFRVHGKHAVDRRLSPGGQIALWRRWILGFVHALPPRASRRHHCLPLSRASQPTFC